MAVSWTRRTAFDCPIVKISSHCAFAKTLRALLQRLGDIRPIILTDGMFAHDGSIAPLKEYLTALPPAGMILLDDCPQRGVLGKNGSGTPEHSGVSENATQITQTITLSKGFGVYTAGPFLGSPLKLRSQS